jgi:hypothetical protein
MSFLSQLFSLWPVWLALAVGDARLEMTERAGQDAVRSGARGLRANPLPWYDARHDQLQPVAVEAESDTLKNRESTWVVGPRTNRPPKRVRPTPIATGLRRGLQIAGWVVLAILLALCAAALAWAFLRGEERRATPAAGPRARPQAAEAAQIDNLPFVLESPQLDLLTEARRQYEAGNYDQAVIYLFSFQLVQLDHHQLIRLEKGKTNRQYLRELYAHVSLRRMVEQVMRLFEDVFFGRRHLSRTQIDACWQRLGEFDAQLEAGHDAV